MIWLTWRQFRAQAIAGGAVMVVIAAYLISLGTRIRDTYDGYLAQCTAQANCADAMARFVGEYRALILLLDGLLILVPLLLGLFWGAPLIARELETGTHRLVWNQSVTRPRWLVVKLLIVGVASMIMAGLCSLLLTWAASPVDQLTQDRFSTVVFGTRNIVPVTYAAFAFVLGAVIGMLLRRTVPAMAVSLLVLAFVQFAVPNLVRPHLMTPVTISKPMTAETINGLGMLGGLGPGAVFSGLTVPDAWVTHASAMLTSDGRPLDADRFNDCMSTPQHYPPSEQSGTFGGIAPCLAGLDLHVMVSYQPNERYWTFQWLESALYLGLSLLLVGFALWRIPRRSRAESRFWRSNSATQP